MNCELCGAGGARVVHIGTRDYADTSVYKCYKCGVEFLYPPPTTDYNDYWSGIDVREKFTADLDEGYTRLLSVKKVVGEFSSILEVGAGSMAFSVLSYCKGYNVSAVEPYLPFHANKGELSSTFSNLDEVSGHYDIVVSFHVLEHIDDPIEFIRKLHTFGPVYIEVPNNEDYMLINRNYRNYFYQKAHLWYFNIHTLRYIARTLGLDVDIYTTQRYNVGNHLYWWMHKKPGGNSRYRCISVTASGIYKYILSRLNISDTLICLFH